MNGQEGGNHSQQGFKLQELIGSWLASLLDSNGSIESWKQRESRLHVPWTATSSLRFINHGFKELIILEMETMHVHYLENIHVPRYLALRNAGMYDVVRTVERKWYLIWLFTRNRCFTNVMEASLREVSQYHAPWIASLVNRYTVRFITIRSKIFIQSLTASTDIFLIGIRRIREINCSILSQARTMPINIQGVW